MSESSGAPPPASGRRYGGKTAVERRRERRSRLVRAGVTVFGTLGFAGTTVRAVCREAGLTERYFYESFEDLPDLFETVVDGVLESTREELGAALAGAPARLADRLVHAVTAVLAHLETDRAHARLLLFPQFGISEALDRRYREGMAGFARLVEDGIEWTSPGALAARELDPRVLATALVGSVRQLATEWLFGSLDLPRATLVDMLVRSILALGFELDDPRRRRPD